MTEKHEAELAVEADGVLTDAEGNPLDRDGRPVETTGDERDDDESEEQG